MTMTAAPYETIAHARQAAQLSADTADIEQQRKKSAVRTKSHQAGLRAVIADDLRLYLSSLGIAPDSCSTITKTFAEVAVRELCRATRN